MSGGARVGTIKQVTLGLNGLPEYLGTIVATTTGVNQTNTGTAFTIPSGSGVLLQTDAAVTVAPIVSGTATPPATTAALDLAAGDKIYMVLREDKYILSCRTSAGTANVKVFLVR